MTGHPLLCAATRSPDSLQAGGAATLPSPALDRTGLRVYFLLSLSSLMPVTLLDVQPGMSVLDLCAAPGAQSLALSHLLWATPTATAADPSHNASPAAPTISRGSGGRLVSNEVDAHRRSKLQRMLVDHVPPELLENGLTTTGHDAHKYWQRQEADTYDRVLVNAPCSSHRQVVQQAARDGRAGAVGGQWSLPACQTAAALQVQLVCAGLRALKVGGRLVFSTCSMCPLENDDVVQRVLQRFSPESLSMLPPSGEGLQLSSQLGGEATKHGVMVLPDRGGWGPVYAAVFEKTSSLVLRMQPVQLLSVELTDSEEEEEGFEGSGVNGNDNDGAGSVVPE
ncbi:MAG: hypothetical protein WDW38_003196 [Sanguina aurantia]